jgi:hypothetical protein
MCNLAYGLQRFCLDYGVVEHTLKNDNGYSKELMEIYKQLPSHGEVIAKYWHNKALKANKQEIDEKIKRYSKNTKKASDEEIDKFYEEIITPLFCSYYYDHWVKINKMIIVKYNYIFPDKQIIIK